MSSTVQGAADRRIDVNYAGERGRRRSRRLLVRAKTAYALARLRAKDDPGNPLSVPTCEKIPTSDYSLAQNRPTEYEYVDHSSPIRTVLLEAWDRSPGRHDLALELAMAGEVSHARRFVNCMRKSAQLECPPMAGGCGSRDNFVPITCDSRLCPECGRRRVGQKVDKFGRVVAGWDYPTMMRVSLPARVDPDAESIETAVDALRGAFGRLRRRVVPADGPGWSWSEWKRSLVMVGATDLARRWQKRFVDQGKGIPFTEIVPAGFYSVDIKQKEDGRLNIHMHALGECPWLPQAALSELWDQLLAAPVVDIRRVDGRGVQDAKDAAEEVVGYAAKPPQFDTDAAKVEYLKAVKGSPLVQPFGALHGNTPDFCGRLLCADCNSAPGWWNYLDVVHGVFDTMAPDWEETGDRPPPG